MLFSNLLFLKVNFLNGDLFNIRQYCYQFQTYSNKCIQNIRQNNKQNYIICDEKKMTVHFWMYYKEANCPEILHSNCFCRFLWKNTGSILSMSQCCSTFWRSRRPVSCPRGCQKNCYELSTLPPRLVSMVGASRLLLYYGLFFRKPESL